MLSPTRPLPRIGTMARIQHFGGDVETGTVCAVADGGRRVEVSCENGERMEFALSPATAKFVLLGAAYGAEMELLAQPQGT